jgi:hypothetical protein
MNWEKASGSGLIEVLPIIFQGGLRKTMKTAVRMSDLPAEI